MCIWTTGLTGVHNTMKVQRMKTPLMYPVHDRNRFHFNIFKQNQIYILNKPQHFIHHI